MFGARFLRRRSVGAYTPPALTVPVITGVPTISGTENVGQTLTATPASVAGNPAPTTTWQWERSGTPISGATASTYTLVGDDEGTTLTVVQTETNSQGSDTAESAPTGTIGAALTAPVITGVPTISGTEQVGETLTASPASVAGNPTPSRTWQWERSNVAISGATSSTYTLVSADEGETITVVQTETNSQGVDSAESAATGAIAPESSASVTGGTITTVGSDQVHTFTSGGTLTVTGGSVEFTYLVVAGGGSGGGAGSPANAAAGGGGGGVLTGTTTLAAGSYAITVGNGGASVSTANTAGNNGGNSSIAALVVASGGGGGAGCSSGGVATAAGNGGSGGGAASAGAVGTGTVGQGNDGGIGSDSLAAGGQRPAGGGGGASAAGGAASQTTVNGNGGDGGAGLSSSISGSAVVYGSGGGGGATFNGVGGAGGANAGKGGDYQTNNATGGTANTGGGGGGAASPSFNATHPSGAGGSGIVIVRWTPA